MKRKVRKQSKQSHEIVVKVEQVPPTAIVPLPTAQDLAEPLKDGGKYMIPKTWMGERQVLRILQATPSKYVYTRPAKGGGTWTYVTGSYIEKVLNYVFGWNWDFEVVGQGKEGDLVWVLGKLTVKDDKGHAVVKTQYGRKEIAFKKGTKEMLDYGNDLKAAATDALKKCASMLGIASDIYGKAEFREETGKAVSEVSGRPEVAMERKQAQATTQYECMAAHRGDVCAAPISEQEFAYSKRVYGKPLCREHQRSAKPTSR